jgi:alpha,alpha-trehalose phosphorylase
MLSACVQSVVAPVIGYAREAYNYFPLGAGIDLADLARNVSDGIDIASCRGVWMAKVDGFAGLRDEDGGDPRFTRACPATGPGYAYL